MEKDGITGRVFLTVLTAITSFGQRLSLGGATKLGEQRARDTIYCTGCELSSTATIMPELCQRCR